MQEAIILIIPCTIILAVCVVGTWIYNMFAEINHKLDIINSYIFTLWGERTKKKKQ